MCVMLNQVQINTGRGLTYVFRWDDESEAELSKCLDDMVQRRDLQFDWLEAHVVRCRVRVRIMEKLMAKIGKLL
jgi:hypothetical protein